MVEKIDYEKNIVLVIVVLIIRIIKYSLYPIYLYILIGISLYIFVACMDVRTVVETKNPPPLKTQLF